MNNIFVELGALGGLIIVLWWLFKDMYSRIKSLEKRLSETRENYVKNTDFAELRTDMKQIAEGVAEIRGFLKSKVGE